MGAARVLPLGQRVEQRAEDGRLAGGGVGGPSTAEGGERDQQHG